MERSPLPVRRTLEKLGIPGATVSRGVDLSQTGGPDALEDRRSRPSRVWTRLPDEVRAKAIAPAPEQPEPVPRDLALRFADEQRHFACEAAVSRRLKAHDPIASPADIGGKAAEDHTKTPAPNPLWQTDLAHLEVTGWGWDHLSTGLDDLSRFLVA